MPPPPPGKLLGRGSGKDGCPTVTDLIKARASEAALRETTDSLRTELADERAKYAKYTFDESVRSARILAGKEFEYMEHINSIHGLSTSSSEATHPKRLLTNVEEPYMLDLRWTHTSERDSTPERCHSFDVLIRMMMIYGASAL